MSAARSAAHLCWIRSAGKAHRNRLDGIACSDRLARQAHGGSFAGAACKIGRCLVKTTGCKLDRKSNDLADRLHPTDRGCDPLAV
jgi:hypothetical protein